jgi:hypothetical protein
MTSSSTAVTISAFGPEFANDHVRRHGEFWGICRLRPRGSGELVTQTGPRPLESATLQFGASPRRQRKCVIMMGAAEVDRRDQASVTEMVEMGTSRVWKNSINAKRIASKPNEMAIASCKNRI